MIKSDKKYNSILYSILRIGWFMVPLFILQLGANYFFDYELEKIQKVLIWIVMFMFTFFFLFQKVNWLKNNFYYILLFFLFILIFVQFIGYIDNRTTKQLFSFLLGITIVGIAVTKPLYTIIFYSITILMLLIVNFYNDYDIFNYVNYFFTSGVCLVAFNYWREHMLLKISLSENSYKSMFSDFKDLVFVIEEDNHRIIELNNSAKKYVGELDESLNFYILDFFKGCKENNQLKNGLESLIDNNNVNFKIISDEDDSTFIAKEFNLKKAIFFENKVIIVTVRFIDKEINNEIKLSKSKENVTKILDNINSFVYNFTYNVGGHRQVRFISTNAEEILKLDLDDF